MFRIDHYHAFAAGLLVSDVKPAVALLFN